MSPIADPGAQVELPEDLKKAIEFHGHLCPGLLIGYRAAKVGLDKLAADRSEDEELIAIVENNSCAVDAVQVLTGASFGKGNFFFRDNGKQVYTFAKRPSGHAVRVALKAEAFGGEPMTREERIQALLTEPDGKIFNIEEKIIALPPEAEIRKSVVCGKCGEPVMDSKTVNKAGVILCKPCAEGN